MTALWANNKTNTGELAKHRKWVNILRCYLQKVHIWTQILDPQMGFGAMDGRVDGWMDGCWLVLQYQDQLRTILTGAFQDGSRLKTSPTQLIWKVRHEEEGERVRSSWNNAYCANQQSDALKIVSWSTSQCRRDSISADLSEAVTLTSVTSLNI